MKTVLNNSLRRQNHLSCISKTTLILIHEHRWNLGYFLKMSVTIKETNLLSKNGI